MPRSITIQKQQVPVPGLGTYQLTGKEGERAISHAIALGYRHIDTAQFYHNEEDVGNAVNNSGVARNQLFITTKTWPTDFVKKNSISFVEQSLRKLKLDHVDLLLLHWPADENGNERGIDMLLEAYHKQYSRLIGVSNFNIPQLEKVRQKAPIFCNQIEYHPYINQREMLEYGKNNDLLLTAYTPLARGKVSKDSTIISIAEKYGKTPGQITLRWLLQQKNVCPIPKGGSEKHLLENLQVFDFQIQNEDMEIISDINSH
jgi:2,5-diketo-D-gluconate reductase B